MKDDVYRAKVDLAYWTDDVKKDDRTPDNQKHVKAKAKVSDLPASSIPWLLADGLIEKVVTT